MADPYDFQSVLPGQWVRVESSWIDAIRWLPPSRLEVRTKAGKVLPYAGASEGDFKEMLRASSKGRHLTYVLKQRFTFVG